MQSTLSTCEVDDNWGIFLVHAGCLIFLLALIDSQSELRYTRILYSWKVSIYFTEKWLNIYWKYISEMYVRCVKHLKSKLNRIKFSYRKNKKIILPFFSIFEWRPRKRYMVHVPDVPRYVCITCSRVDLELYNTIILSRPT